MDVVTGALGSLISKLGELLKDEYNLQKDMRKQVDSLSLELESAQATLRKVGDVPPEQLDEQVRIWAREVREASYNMEDVLDTFLVERLEGDHEHTGTESLLQRLKDKAGGMLTMMGSLFKRRKISVTINEIKQHLHDVTERRGRYTIDSIGAEPAAKSTIDPRLPAMYKKVTELIGIDKSRGELKTMLYSKEGSGSTEKMKIVAVVGIGGLGKTTLAKAVYDELTVNIPYKAFVPVGQNPDLKKTLRDILIDLDKQRYTTVFNLTMLDERQLIDELRDFLEDKRYFIVIDDIWDIESWKMIKNALDDNSLGSKIVITTRKNDVAEEAGCSYKLKPLTHESSKLLFYGRIFGSEGECPSQFTEVSENILKKCGGVPLAIVTTSSLLSNKSRNIKVWNEICDSIGSGLGSNHNMENMREILSLSYFDLPSHLKTCLLYLSIFPEDYEIGKTRLIWWWIAEDFILQHGEESQSLFELGESYFNELINRSLIQLARTNVDGTPWSCRVHDMVLELICSLSRQENFVTTILGDSRQRTPRSGSKIVRRLSLQNTAWPTMEMSKLRSIAIFDSAITNSMLSLSCCHLLRVLDLQECNLEDDRSLRFVGNLSHLRYLSLAQTGYGGELPAEIGKLQFLQTLDLWRTRIDELPSSIEGLGQLICLNVPQGTRLPNGLRCVTLLEELLQVSVDSTCMVEVLGHLTQLRKLYVWLKKDKDGRWDEGMCTAFVRSIAKLHKIQKLIVHSNDVAADLEGSVESLGNLSFLYINRTTSLPTWISPASLPLLSYLKITMVKVRKDDIRVLGVLQALRVLEVEISGDEIQMLERFTVSTDAFPCAIECAFFGFSMAPSAFPSGAMPRLEEFSFYIRLEDFAAGKFTCDDLALGHLPCLQSVLVHLREEEDVSEEVVMEVNEKLRHEVDVHSNNPALKSYNISIADVPAC